MNDDTDKEDWMPTRKSGYQLPTPSVFLREKILNEASIAWDADTQDPEALPWVLPTLRLAASITIAVMVVVFAQMADHYSLARWHSSNESLINSKNTNPSSQWSEVHPELINIRQIATSSFNRDDSMDLMIYLQRLRNSAVSTDSNREIKRHHSTEFFLNPKLHNHLINPTEILES